MVLPLFTVPPMITLPAAGSLVVLAGPEAKHAISVRRMRVGEGIQVSDGRGNRVVGNIVSIDGNQLSLEVSESNFEAAAEPTITLVQALAKGDRDELAIQAATELGVEGVTPWQADRSVSRWDGPKVAKGVERWQTIVAEAAKQALRARTPQVTQPASTKELSGLIRKYDLALVLDPTAQSTISGVSLPSTGSIAIVVGPEGGISESELALLENSGATRVRLGTDILRTSTAGMAAISVLQGRLNRW